MAVPISNVVRRIVFAPSGTGPYAFTFEILAATDIEVYKGDTLLTLTTDYTVTINPNGTGSVTLVATAGTDNITIVGARTIQRTTDFVTGGDLFANSLNEELDSLTIFTQQNAEAGDRSIRAPVTDPTTIDMTLPTKADRAGKYLSFNASTGDPEVVNTVLDITAVANNTANINTVAGQISPVNNISTVAGAATNIATVAGIAANVTTVAGISGNVTTVAGISADVTTVAADGTDIGTVAGLSTEIAALGPIAADITTVAGIDSDVTAVAADATDIGTVASNIANVNTVAGISSNVTTVAGISADVTAVAGDATDIGTVAGIAANVTTVAGIAANVTTVAGISSDVTTVATNVADITNFSDVYLGPKSSDPATRNDSSALQEGDLYFNTVDDAIKVYTGSAWVTAYITADGFVTVADAQTITGVKTFDNGLNTDTISEETSAAGVTVDGVLLKDSQVTTDQINEKTSAAGVTIDGVLLKDGLVNSITVGQGAGAVSTNTAVGASVLAANEAGGTNNTAIGYQALDANTTGDNNVGVGDSALGANTTTSANTAIGSQALANNTAADNTAIGFQAGLDNTSGTGNFFGGSLAGNKNTTGSGNTGIGGSWSGTALPAFYFNTTGSSNTAIGCGALPNNTTASNNTAVGYQAGYSNTTGNQLTAIGYTAGYSHTTGVSNTFLGRESGYATTTGSSNTFVGANAGELITTGAKNSILGRYNGNQGGLDIRTASNWIVLSDGDGNPRMRMNGSGLFCPEVYSITGAVSANVYVDPSGNLYRATSSLKYKTDVQDASHGLSDLMKLRSVTYKSKKESEFGMVFGGLIAEEVDAAGLNEFVQYAEDGSPDALAYGNMVSLCVKAIQELSAQVTALQAEVNALKGQ
jgi:hypothetical protein